MSDKQDFFNYLAPTSPFPLGLEIDRGDGVYLFDVHGKKYMDLIAGIGVASLGHAHPEVTEAVSRQIRKYGHVMVYGEYIQKPVVQLAKALAARLPNGLQSAFFVNSGTEANEAAMKLAKRITGRYKIIAFDKSYHGNTQGSMSVSGNEYRKRAFRPLIPGIRFIEFNDTVGLDCIDESIAAVIAEPIMGDAGVVIPKREYMKQLRKKCTDTGAQLIFDEVQTGIGRTGKMFAFEHFGIQPDILTLAKGLGGGLPIGAMISSYDNMQQFSHDPMLGHITTFGGNPVCCAAALATLKEILKPGILDKIEEKGAFFEEELRHPEIVAIRRKGLMMAIELKNEELVNKVIEKALDKGIIVYWFLSTRNSFRISPPLNITFDELELASSILKDILSNL